MPFEILSMVPSTSYFTASFPVILVFYLKGTLKSFYSMMQLKSSNDSSLCILFQTHPTQSCFMSSIDVHTQYSYQVSVLLTLYFLNRGLSLVCLRRLRQSLYGLLHLNLCLIIGMISSLILDSLISFTND